MFKNLRQNYVTFFNLQQILKLFFQFSTGTCLNNTMYYIFSINCFKTAKEVFGASSQKLL